MEAVRSGADRGTLPAEVDARLEALAGEAAALVGSAGAEHFDDLARQAESLRVQLLGARNKLRLLPPRA
jgi:hypothetical protein